MIKPWTAQELDVLAALYGKKMNWQIAELMPGRTDNGVKLKARSLGLIANRTVTRKQYEVNQSYFDVPNLENSYWAGFIAADGNIGDPKDRVKIKLIESDAHHLVTFSKNCGSTSPLRNEPNGLKNYCSLEIYGVPRWRTDLAQNFCITPRKTLTLQPPTHLTRDMSLAFIVGYIDGDGCIFTEKPRTGHLRLGLYLIGTKEMMMWVQSWFNAIAPSIHTANVNPCGRVCTYKIVGRKAEAVCQALLLFTVPRLNRKWTKASHFLEQKEKDDCV